MDPRTTNLARLDRVKAPPASAKSSLVEEAIPTPRQMWERWRKWLPAWILATKGFEYNLYSVMLNKSS